jgi:ABC-2 type transport system permease protein
MPIFDQGYQHWNGTLSGHAWRWLAITRRGVRIGMQGRVLRMFLLLSLLPAAGLVIAISLWGLIEQNAGFVTPLVQLLVSMGFLSRDVAADPRHYRVEVWTMCYTYFHAFELFLSMILILLVGPELISQDLRFNALPLYLSRPLRRIDYFAGKLGVIAAFLGLVIIVPSLLAYALGLLFSLDWTILRDTYSLLLASLTYGVVIIVSAGTLILALSSLSRNSRYVALFWLALWIMSAITSIILQVVDESQRSQEAYNRAVAQQAAAAGAQPAPEPVKGRGRGRFDPQIRRAVREQVEKENAQVGKTNWRPMVSFQANYTRIGEQLLGTQAARHKLFSLQSDRGPRIEESPSSELLYPWYWSGGVLAGLFVLSVCILSLSVRSLDRLR